MSSCCVRCQAQERVAFDKSSPEEQAATLARKREKHRAQTAAATLAAATAARLQRTYAQQNEANLCQWTKHMQEDQLLGKVYCLIPLMSSLTPRQPPPPLPL